MILDSLVNLVRDICLPKLRKEYPIKVKIQLPRNLMSEVLFDITNNLYTVAIDLLKKVDRSKGILEIMIPMYELEIVTSDKLMIEEMKGEL